MYNEILFTCIEKDEILSFAASSWLDLVEFTK